MKQFVVSMSDEQAATLEALAGKCRVKPEVLILGCALQNVNGWDGDHVAFAETLGELLLRAVTEQPFDESLPEQLTPEHVQFIADDLPSRLKSAGYSTLLAKKAFTAQEDRRTAREDVFRVQLNLTLDQIRCLMYAIEITPDNELESSGHGRTVETLRQWVKAASKVKWDKDDCGAFTTLATVPIYRELLKHVPNPGGPLCVQWEACDEQEFKRLLKLAREAVSAREVSS